MDVVVHHYAYAFAKPSSKNDIRILRATPGKREEFCPFHRHDPAKIGDDLLRRANDGFALLAKEARRTKFRFQFLPAREHAKCSRGGVGGGGYLANRPGVTMLRGRRCTAREMVATIFPRPLWCRASGGVGIIPSRFAAECHRFWRERVGCSPSKRAGFVGVLGPVALHASRLRSLLNCLRGVFSSNHPALLSSFRTGGTHASSSSRLSGPS